MKASAKQTTLISHQILSAVYMMKNDANVMSAVSDFGSPVAATSNFGTPIPAAASDQKKAKQQSNDKRKTDPRKSKRQASETAERSMNLPGGDDDNDDFDDMA